MCYAISKLFWLLIEWKLFIMDSICIALSATMILLLLQINLKNFL